MERERRRDGERGERSVMRERPREGGEKKRENNVATNTTRSKSHFRFVPGSP